MYIYIYINDKTKQIEHHGIPRQASGEALLRTGAGVCKTDAGAGRSAEAKTQTDRMDTFGAEVSWRKSKQPGERASPLVRTGAVACARKRSTPAGMPQEEPNTAITFETQYSPREASAKGSSRAQEEWDGTSWGTIAT